MKHFLFILTFFSAASAAFAQQQYRIMTYNLLNYPSADTNVRNPHFRTVINSIDPDILIVNEINNQSGVNAFLSNVMNFGGSIYSAGTFISGPDSENALFFKTSKFNFISNTAIPTQTRDINEFRICDKINFDTLRIYAVHLKANLQDSAMRGAEIDSLRMRTDLLPAGSEFIVAGDFNIYSANESAYKKLVKDNPGDDGNFIDPLNMPGVWNSASYAVNHTQSTRVRSFGDGSTGGLDDRFDMILYSNGVKNSGGIRFIPSTYRAYGNDGNHYNDSINQIPNTAVTQAIANALHYASDHLPVYATFEFGGTATLSLKAIPQGMYDPGNDRLRRRDSSTVYLRSSIMPYAMIDSAKGVIDSITFNTVFKFTNIDTASCYIVMKTINTLETWSSTGIVLKYDSTRVYDFTDLASKAFGSNQVLSGSRYCVYSGDVNNDGQVNLSDIFLTFNSVTIFETGYLVNDMNGDMIVNLDDLIIVNNNSQLFVSVVRP